MRRADRAARGARPSSRCPRTTAEVQAVVRICNDARIPFVARGAGTGLSGGALPVADGIVISLARMNRVALDRRRRGHGRGRAGRHEPRRDAGGRRRRLLLRARPVVAAGLHDRRQRRRELGRRALPEVRLHRQPRARGRDRPARRRARRARRSGTTAPTCSACSSARRGRSGSRRSSRCVCCARRRRVRTLLAGFEHTDAAGAAVSGTIAAGILPAAIEMMDAITIEAAEAAVGANYPPDCGAVLIVELDGPLAQVEEDLDARRALCHAHGARRGADRRRTRPTARPSGAGGRPRSRAMGRVEPELLRPGRRRAAHEAARGAAPDRRAVAGARPARRQRLPRRRRQPASARALRRRGSTARPSAPRSSRTAILEACIDAGGSITGEHGVGSDKACAMPLMFGADDLERDAARSAARSTRSVLRTRASSSRRRGSAARCPGPTACIHSSRQALPSASEHARSSSTSRAT